jgi:hypothetical protein
MHLQMIKVCFIVFAEQTLYLQLADGEDATKCALAILSMTGAALDDEARLKLLGLISEMPEGVDIVKWLYKLLVKSMFAQTLIPTCIHQHK